MKNDEIRAANRKALPKFLLFTLVCAVIGGIAGYCAARYGLDQLSGVVANASAFFGTRIAPWLMVALAVVTPAVCIPMYRHAKALLASWDGEDEDVSSVIDGKLSAALWASSASLVLAFFLIAATYSVGFASFDSWESTVLIFIGIAAFLAILVESILIQQKCVDAAKQMSPEKKASIYDLQFQKKWMDDCDEAEKIMIGKCAFKAYSAVNRVCAIAAIVLAICALVFGIGFLPSRRCASSGWSISLFTARKPCVTPRRAIKFSDGRREDIQWKLFFPFSSSCFSSFSRCSRGESGRRRSGSF